MNNFLLICPVSETFWWLTYYCDLMCSACGQTSTLCFLLSSCKDVNLITELTIMAVFNFFPSLSIWPYSEFLGIGDFTYKLGGNQFSCNTHSWVGVLMTLGAKIVALPLWSEVRIPCEYSGGDQENHIYIYHGKGKHSPNVYGLKMIWAFTSTTWKRISQI